MANRVTKRKLGRQLAPEFDDTFRVIFDCAPSGMCMTALDGGFTRVNRALCTMLGYSEQELLALSWDQLTHPDDIGASRKARAELSCGPGEALELEKRYIHKSGRVVLCRLKLMPARRSSGKVSHFVAQIEGITQSKRAAEAQAFLASLIESTRDAIIGTTVDGTVVSWNRGACEIYGYAADEVIGKPLSVLTPPEQADELHRILHEVGHQEQTRTYEAVRLRKDGTRVDVAVTLSPVLDPSGKVTGIAIIVHNITNRRLREEQTYLLTAALESVPNGIVIADRHGTILWVNPALTRLTGYTAEEVVGQPTRVLRPGAEVPSYYKDLWATTLRGDTWHGEITSRRKGGTLFDEDMTVTPVRAADGSINHVVAVKQDITGRKQAEQALRNSEEMFRQLAENIREVFWLKEPEKSDFLYISPAYEQIWGRTRASFYQNPASRLEAIHPDDLERSRQVFAKQDQGEAVATEYRIRAPDGGEKWIRSRAFPVLDQAGKLFRIAGIAEEITEKKQWEARLVGAQAEAEAANRRLSAERAILEGERQILRALIDNVPDFMYVKDTESRFVVANAYLARVMGVNKPEQLIGKSDFDFFPHEMAERFYEDEQALLRSGQPLYNREETCLDEAGHEIRILTTKVPIRDGDGKLTGIAGVGRNISARIQMEDALREAEHKYRGIFDNAIVGIFQSTPEGRFVSVNSAMASMFGYSSPEEMVALITDIAHQFYADSKKREDFKARIATEGGVQNFEYEALRKDGSKIWLSMSVRGIFRDGTVIRYEGMCEDISERRLLRDQLLQAQKLESVGQLAAGIAHEINTPTQFIGDNTQFVKKSFHDLKSLWEKLHKLVEAAREDDRYRSILEDISATAEKVDSTFLLGEIPKALDQSLDGVSRVATLVSAMKEFSHPGTKEKTPLDLNHAIESTITVSRNEWKYVADLETDFDESLPQVTCLPAELNQVVLNLIVNAAHAVADVVRSNGADRGKITIQTRNLQTCAEIRIKDTGTGIPAGIRSRIFDPFFTTKEIGKGTGQGLSIAHSVVVDKHGGTIRFETEEGKGTTFIICLPYSSPKPGN